FQRIMGNMARALGIRQPPSAQPQAESKSYFVTDVFKRVVFPDQHLAGRTAAELRRQKFIRAGIAAASVFVGSLLIFPAIASMAKNRSLITETEEASAVAAAVPWSGSKPASEKVENLQPTRSH